ncbi:MAG: phenylalanine 4-monooxygenase [Alphaproteobacteria bacterium]|nr:phenylalanine 4-monooxygenase [Alphaproteobacteria bacterium]
MKAQKVQDLGNPTGHGNPDDWQKYIVDQGWKNYTDEEHDVWKTLYERQMELMPGRACQEFFDGIEALQIDKEKIPDFEEVNKILKEKTGWEVVAVEGLIPDLPFFKLLSERKFPAGYFIRTREQLDYIQEPDVFHDLFGHVPLLSNPIFGDYLENFGKGGLRAHEFGTIKNLSRLYWFTVEFGLMQTPEGMRIYGSGILSSPGETVFSLEDDSPNRIGFDLKRIMQTQYRVDDYQQTYFVIESFEQLFKETYADFAPLYKVLKEDDTLYGLAEIAPNDDVLTKGTQQYATERQKAAEAV